jgi:ABC-type lipoprotein release transport system permease subunit
MGLGRVLANQLFETSTRDPVAIAVAVVVLAAVLTLALYIPARRASRCEPTEALRSE